MFHGFSISSAVFVQLTADSPYTLQWAASSPWKLTLHKGSLVPWAHLSPQPKQHLDRFSRFCRAHDHDRQTDHNTSSVTIGHIFVHSTAMKPKKLVALQVLDGVSTDGVTDRCCHMYNKDQLTFYNVTDYLTQSAHVHILIRLVQKQNSPSIKILLGVKWSKSGGL